jgi:Sec-independent protein translocase protein TatA
MGGLGKGMKEFKKATSDAESTVVKEKDELKNVIKGEVTNK